MSCRAGAPGASVQLTGQADFWHPTGPERRLAAAAEAAGITATWLAGQITVPRCRSTVKLALGELPPATAGGGH